MEPAPPQTIRSLASSIGVEIEDLLLSCFYCTRWLTVLDKILFAHCELVLHCKEGLYYGACQPCVRSAARVDFLLNYESFISTRRAAEIFGRPFPHLEVRCWSCLRHLNNAEKCDIVCRDGDVAILKDKPRALCTLCTIGLQ